ncbi:unnamed protein product, partial [Owenia fusiformis]
DADIASINGCFKYTSTILKSTLDLKNETLLKNQTQALLQVAKNLFQNLGEYSGFMSGLLRDVGVPLDPNSNSMHNSKKDPLNAKSKTRVKSKNNKKVNIANKALKPTLKSKTNAAKTLNKRKDETSKSLPPLRIGGKSVTSSLRQGQADNRPTLSKVTASHKRKIPVRNLSSPKKQIKRDIWSESPSRSYHLRSRLGVTRSGNIYNQASLTAAEGSKSGLNNSDEWSPLLSSQTVSVQWLNTKILQVHPQMPTQAPRSLQASEHHQELSKLT